jgi:hypothetical protein
VLSGFSIDDEEPIEVEGGGRRQEKIKEEKRSEKKRRVRKEEERREEKRREEEKRGEKRRRERGGKKSKEWCLRRCCSVLDEFQPLHSLATLSYMTSPLLSFFSCRSLEEGLDVLHRMKAALSLYAPMIGCSYLR